MKARLNFGRSTTGLVLGDLTISLLWLASDPTTSQVGVLDVGATLEEVGLGIYYLNAPLVTEVGGVSVRKTTDAAVWADGEFTTTGELVPSSVISGLCTLADVKAILKFTSSTFDQAVTDKIAAAENYFQQETGYTLLNTEHTEYFSPGQRSGSVSRDLRRLRVKEHPIISVTSLFESDDRTFVAGDEIAAADYFFNDHGIELYADGDTVEFSAGQRTVRAIYRAGYATVPAFLRNGVAHHAAWLYYQDEPGKMRSAIASESMGDATVTYLNEKAPKIVEAAVAMFKRPCGL